MRRLQFVETAPDARIIRDANNLLQTVLQDVIQQLISLCHQTCFRIRSRWGTLTMCTRLPFVRVECIPRSLSRSCVVVAVCLQLLYRLLQLVEFGLLITSQ